MRGVEVRPSLGRQPRRGKIHKMRSIAKILEGQYGPRVWTKRDDPLSQLIKTILSQNTTDTNSRRAFQSLRDRFPTWSQVRKASVPRIADAIRSGGLAHIKALRIKGILSHLYQEHGHCDLSFLVAWPTEQIRDFLTQFTGVGEKTIACVLLFSLGRPVMPVDTHVLRVSKRLGFVPSKVDANGAHRLLQATVPEDLVYPLHLNLIQHGRTTCKARNPVCERCVLRQECSAYPLFQAQRG